MLRKRKLLDDFNLNIILEISMYLIKNTLIYFKKRHDYISEFTVQKCYMYRKILRRSHRCNNFFSLASAVRKTTLSQDADVNF